MKIEYTVSADRQIQGNGWVCYYRDLNSFSAIFNELLVAIEQSENSTLEELKDIVKTTEKLSPAKSRADVYAYGDIIEICKPNKSLPHIWIVEK